MIKTEQKKSSLAAIIAIFAGGNLITMGLRLVGGVLTARFAPPAVLGLFNGIGLLIEYAPVAQLGILNGLNRELPYYIGQGDRERAHELASAAQFWALCLGGFGATALITVAIWYASTGRWDLAAGWLANSFALFMLFYSQMYLQVTFRTSGDFARLSVITVLQNSASLLMVSLVWFYGFYGLCLRSVCVGLIGAVLLWKYCPIKVKPRWNKQHLFQLFKIGSPIFMVGQIYALWIVIDSTLVLKYMGVKGLGLYQLAVMAGQMMETLPNAVAQIIYPKMAEEYGRNSSLIKLIEIAIKPMLATLAVIAPLVIIAWYALPPVVEWFLPKYIDGISAARWAMLSAASMAVAPVNSVYNVIKRQDLYLLCILFGIAAYFACLLWLNVHEIKLNNFPQSVLAGRVIFLLSSYGMLAKLISQKTQLIKAN